MDSTNNSGIDEFRVSVDAVVAEITRQRDDALARVANMCGQLAVLRVRIDVADNASKVADEQNAKNG